MVPAAFSDATATALSNRAEAGRVRNELAQVDQEIGTASALLVDPDVLAELMAKKSLLRKAAGRAGLQASLNRLSRVALNLLKRDKSVKIGIHGKRLKAGWDEPYLLRLLTS